MLTFPTSLFLIPYGLVAVFVVLLAIVNVLHLVHYGATTKLSFAVTFAFLAGMVFIFFFTWRQLEDVDWQRPIEIALPVGNTTFSSFSE
jgi:threonine synthase